MPCAMVVTYDAGPSPTPTSCFVENAGITGCGRNKKYKLPIFWSSNMCTLNVNKLFRKEEEITSDTVLDFVN